MLTRSRARSIGWAVILSLCLGLTLALTFRVNAVKSQVRLTERKIVALRMEKSLLETEFETRSNQQQLRALNDVEFGYQAPTARQYLESERQLAALGKPRSPDAPAMIRLAKSDPQEAQGSSILPAMVNPLTGRAIAAEVPREKQAARDLAAASTPATLAERLGRVDGAGREGAKGKVERLSHVEDKPRALAKGALERGALARKPAASEMSAPGKPASAKSSAKSEVKLAKAHSAAHSAPARPAPARVALRKASGAQLD